MSAPRKHLVFILLRNPNSCNPISSVICLISFRVMTTSSKLIYFESHNRKSRCLFWKTWRFWSILTSSGSTKWKRISVWCCAVLLTLRCPHGSTRTGSEHRWRLQGRLFTFILLVRFLILTETPFVRGIPMATSATVPSISTTAEGPSGQPGRPGSNQHT